MERVAIAQVIFRPGLAVGALVFSDYHDGDIRLAGNLSRLANAGLLSLWIGEFDLVLIPRRPTLLAGRDLAAFSKHDLGGGTDAALDSFENAHLIAGSGIATVSTQVDI